MVDRQLGSRGLAAAVLTGISVAAEYIPLAEGNLYARQTIESSQDNDLGHSQLDRGAVDRRLTLLGFSLNPVVPSEGLIGFGIDCLGQFAIEQ